ncbi:MAG: hypothetical protein HYU28_06360 [Actinobacteria bacterium]|nr:hypothetical protein [Actinomycetota bacterium]
MPGVRVHPYNGPPTDADVAETPEVRLSPEIVAKAAELGHDPEAIYEYVYNTIEYVPKFGSMQDSTTTLLAGAGNEMAQSPCSLLCCVPRASPPVTPAASYCSRKRS